MFCFLLSLVCKNVYLDIVDRDTKGAGASVVYIAGRFLLTDWSTSQTSRSQRGVYDTPRIYTSYEQY